MVKTGMWFVRSNSVWLGWKNDIFILKTSLFRKREIQMFLATLSSALTYLCDAHKWSYRATAEHCDLSARCIGSIAHGNANPTICTLEKLCTAFHLLPNDLLVAPDLFHELVFRSPLQVTECRCYDDWLGLIAFPVCPQCHEDIEREYQAYCTNCGQKLCWKGFSKVKIIMPPDSGKRPPKRKKK